MEKEKLERINFLARESKKRALTDKEMSEQASLRKEYLAEIRASFGADLDNIYFKNPDGSVTKLEKKK